ncbi:MAG: hypothetical protein QXU43_00940, partial [Thermoproteota archaeon]
YMGFHGINTGIGVYGFSRSDLPSHMEQEGASSLPTSSIPSSSNFPDWVEALTWIRYNTPPGSVILSWWDYGYWITALGERPTLIDNATINSTQVAVVGRIFMSNDTIAVPLLKRYNISYIVVFNTLPLYWAMGGNVYGDEAKWRWMAAIGYNLKPVNGSYDWISDLDYTKGGYADLTLSGNMKNATLFTWYNTQVKYLPSYLNLPKADSVLTRLLVNAYSEATQKTVPKYLGIFPKSPPEEIKLSTAPFYELVFLSPSNGFVSVYRVNYNFSYGEEFMTLGSSEGVALRNSSRFYNMPLVPGVQMVVDVKTLRIVEGEARVDNASKVLSAKVSLAVRVNGEVKRLYPASLGKYSLRYWNNSLQVFLNQTLLDETLLPSDLKNVETGLILFAEGVETGSIEKGAFAYVNYEVRIELP